MYYLGNEIKRAWQSVSPDRTVKGFKKSCISNPVDVTDDNVMNVTILNFYITIHLVRTCRCPEFLQFVTSRKKFSHSFLQTQQYLTV